MRASGLIKANPSLCSGLCPFCVSVPLSWVAFLNTVTLHSFRHTGVLSWLQHPKSFSAFAFTPPSAWQALPQSFLTVNSWLSLSLNVIFPKRPSLITLWKAVLQPHLVSRELVLVHSGCCNKNALSSVAYKQQTFISHSYGGWKVKDYGSDRLVSGENLLSGSQKMHFHCVFTWWKGARDLWEVPWMYTVSFSTATKKATRGYKESLIGERWSLGV